MNCEEKTPSAPLFPFLYKEPARPASFLNHLCQTQSAPPQKSGAGNPAPPSLFTAEKAYFASFKASRTAAMMASELSVAPLATSTSSMFCLRMIEPTTVFSAL